MARVLISSIGKGHKEKMDYSKANYKIENEIYKEEKFIASALSKHFKIDKNIILGTSGSIWEALYESFIPDTKEIDDSFQLDLLDKRYINSITSNDLKVLEDKIDGRLKCFLIDFGKNDEELMSNFNIIMSVIDELEKGDTLYIDITHSFRSLAFYMFIILNFLQNISSKNIKIQYISYGMLEATENGITPVINLNILYEAVEWIKAASDFKKYGDSEPLCNLLSNDLNKSKAKLLTFTNALNLSYVTNLKKQIKVLYDSCTEFEKIEGFGKFVIPDVINDIVGRYKKYYKEKQESLFLLATAKMFYDYRVYSSAYIFLQEAIIVHYLDFDCKENNKENQNQIKAALENPNFHPSEDFKKLNKIFLSLKSVRNALAHAIDITYKSSIAELDYVKDFEVQFYNPVITILNKNIDFKMFK